MYTNCGIIGSEEVTIRPVANNIALAISSESQTIDLHNVQDEYESNMRKFYSLLELFNPSELSSSALELNHTRFSEELYTALQKLNSSIDTLIRHTLDEEEIAGYEKQKTENMGEYRKYLNCVAARIKGDESKANKYKWDSIDIHDVQGYDWDLFGKDIETEQKTEEKDDTETLSSTSEIDMEGKVLKETQDDELPEVLMKDEKLPVLNRDPPTEPGHRIDPNSTLPSSKIEKCTNSSFTTPLSKPTKRNGDHINKRQFQ